MVTWFALLGRHIVVDGEKPVGPVMWVAEWPGRARLGLANGRRIDLRDDQADKVRAVR